MITRKDVYSKVVGLQENGHNIGAESHGNPRRIYITSKDQSRNFAGGLTPREAMLWIDGYIEGLWTHQIQ